MAFEDVPTDGARLVSELPARVEQLRAGLATRIVGQEETIRQLLIAFFSGGHVLVTGVPGLAKTLMVSTLAELFDLGFSRIQFTPDLMPSDITGTTIIVRDESTGQRDFKFRGGPIFTNMLLADEINRTPPKTQAALLEAMEEYQVTVGGHGYPVDRPFFVLATQNPIEQEGTYPLPITQLDRFLFQINMDYPDAETEFEVVATTTAQDPEPIEPVLTRDQVITLLGVARTVRIPTSILERATALVRATRTGDEPVALDGHSGGATDTANEFLSWGAGPRAIQSVLTAARAAAVLSGRTEVTDSDYEEVLLPSLRHRILLSYHAEAEKIEPDDVLRRLRLEIGDGGAPVEVAPPREEGRFARLLRVIGDPSPSINR